MRNNHKNKSKKKRAVILLSMLAILATISGTFAWTSYTKWVKNHMQSNGIVPGEVTIVEEFPTGVITPGSTLTKKVSVTNASGTPVFVRVSFEEMLNRLEDNAKSQGYDTLEKSGFPVVINPSEYVTASTGWKDISNKLRIDGSVAPIAVKASATVPAGKDGYKLYEKDDSVTIIYVKNIEKKAYPKEFDFNFKGEKATIGIPTFSGDFKDSKSTQAQVAQKVSGTAEKLSNGTFNFKTKASGATSANGGLEYYGYGKKVGPVIEKNWAGSAVNVAKGTPGTPAPTGKFNESQADGRIKFVSSDISETPLKTGTKPTSKWFYNKDDGYFYYTERLEANTTTSANVIKGIAFPDEKNGGDEFKVASYNLWVGLEAIPSYQAALKAPMLTTGSNGTHGGGWGLDVSKPADQAMFDYFASIAIAE